MDGWSSSLGIVISDEEAKSLFIGDERFFFLVLLVGEDGFDKIFVVINGDDERFVFPIRERFDSKIIISKRKRLKFK